MRLFPAKESGRSYSTCKINDLVAKKKEQSRLRDKFPGYYRRTDEELEAIWRDGLFVLDASVLLNLYRYSEGTRKELLGVLWGVQERLWVPHQAAEEFHRRRLNAIKEQKEAYSEVCNFLSVSSQALAKEIKSIHKGPAEEITELLQSARATFDQLLAEVKKVEEEAEIRSRRDLFP
jgi:hypothetical protein